MSTLKRLSEKDLQHIKKELATTIEAYWESAYGRQGKYGCMKEKNMLYTLIKTVRKYNELTKEEAKAAEPANDSTTTAIE